MGAIILIGDSSGAFTSIETHLQRGNLPASLIKQGLRNTDLIKVETSTDNGKSWFQVEDANGLLQFAATGRNVIPLNVPLIFRLNRVGIAAISITSVVSGTAIAGGGNYARFTYTAGPVVKVGDKITVAGFTAGNVPYNTTGIITVTTTTYFEMNSEATGLPVAFIGSGTGTGELLSSVTLSLGTSV